MPSVNTQQEYIPAPLDGVVRDLIREWRDRGNLGRLWTGDATLWTSSGESDWLGWLLVIDRLLADIRPLQDFSAEVKGRFSHAVLLGMGGSSLCPEVLRLCFGTENRYPDLIVVDSTDPAQIDACERSIRLESTLFLSASKSGTTLETSLLTRYFLDRLTQRFGVARAAQRFVAITDPGSALERLATDLGFGRVFHGAPTIGGRYSALSHFGMVPAAAIGLDVGGLLRSAQAMHAACSPDVVAEANPGLRLGALLGAAALAGRDKLTFVCSPSVASLGTWIEQLVAESTGKNGKGIVPVEGEDLAAPASYGDDRLFVSISSDAERDPARDATLDQLLRVGHPVVRISMRGIADIGQEFFRWEVATAVAGSILGINPFDQPDVESAKIAARRLTQAYEAQGSLPVEAPFFEDGRFRFFASREHAAALLGATEERSARALLRSHLSTARPRDYMALQAFVRRDERTVRAMGRVREAVRSAGSNATCVGFGPRFLHSTGQLHKGGADNGVFIQIGCDEGPALPVPGSERGLTLGVVKNAQALGDFDVLAHAGRRALRVQIAGDLEGGLAALEAAFAEIRQ